MLHKKHTYALGLLFSLFVTHLPTYSMRLTRKEKSKQLAKPLLSEGKRKKVIAALIEDQRNGTLTGEREDVYMYKLQSSGVPVKAASKLIMDIKNDTHTIFSPRKDPTR